MYSGVKLEDSYVRDQINQVTHYSGLPARIYLKIVRVLWTVISDNDRLYPGSGLVIMYREVYNLE